MLAKRMERVSESATMKIAAETIRLKSQGIEIVNLGIGEPDFNTPDNIKRAGHKAIDDNHSHYTLARGVAPLREAISKYLKEEFRANYQANEIVVCHGAKQAIFNTILAIADEGDEVIIPTPCWPTYIECVNLAGGTNVKIDTTIEDNFKITAQQLKNAITGKTKAVLISNPSNPTGMVYDEKEIRELAAVAKEAGIYIISDEIYGKLIYDNFKFFSFGELKEYLDNKLILIQGASKAYAMTGWRLGFLAGPAEIVKACDIIQGHSTSNASTIAQYAAIAAFSEDQGEVEKMRLQFAKRRKFVMDSLKSINGISVCEPQGAFYVFPRIDYFYGVAPDGTEIKNSTDLTLYLLSNAHAAVVPGFGFEAEDHIRISYATSMELLEKSLGNIKAALAKIQKN